MNQDNDYIEYLNKFSNIETYIVGGAVRNYLYNKFHNSEIKIKDYDYLIRGINQNDLIEILEKIGIVKEVGQSFGIVLFKPFNSDEHIEFAIPRTEISTGSNYRDFLITADPNITIEEDFSRRDSTINAIGIKINKIIDFSNCNVDININEFIDPFNGIDDIKNKIWRAVGDPEKRFREDPTRIMRAFRQSSELNLEIEKNTFEAIKKNNLILKNLIPQSFVRLYNEFFRILSCENYMKYLITMNDLEILKILKMENVNLENLKNTVLNFKNISVIEKFCILMEFNKFHKNISVFEWCNERQITATNYINKFDINFFDSVHKFYNEIINLKEVTEIYHMLKILEKIHKLYKTESYDICKKIIYLGFYKFDISFEELNNLKNLLNETKKYPYSTDQLVLNGNILISKFKINGKKIKDIKETMLNKIFKNEVSNNLEDLEKIVISLL